MKKTNFNIVGKFGTILADPPWEFKNKTGKIAPQYKKTSRYKTLSLEDIKLLPVERVASKRSHLYLWVPNAFTPNIYEDNVNSVFLPKGTGIDKFKIVMFITFNSSDSRSCPSMEP